MRKKKATQRIRAIGEAAHAILERSAAGHENAIPKARLRLMVSALAMEQGQGLVHERDLRAGIAHVTTDKGYPIASATRPPWGYYIMRPGERKDLRRAMLTRVAALVRRMRAVDHKLARRIWATLQRDAGEDFQGDLFT